MNRRGTLLEETAVIAWRPSDSDCSQTRPDERNGDFSGASHGENIILQASLSPMRSWPLCTALIQPGPPTSPADTESTPTHISKGLY